MGTNSYHDTKIPRPKYPAACGSEAALLLCSVDTSAVTQLLRWRFGFVYAEMNLLWSDYETPADDAWVVLQFVQGLAGGGYALEIVAKPGSDLGLTSFERA